MGISQNEGYLVGGPHNKDHGILGSKAQVVLRQNACGRRGAALAISS